MTIIILDIPQVEGSADDYQVPVNQWLEAAGASDKASLTHPHACIGTDGTRMHIANNADPDCNCGNSSLHSGFNRIIENAEMARFSFAVSRQLLIEALSGINPDDDCILFFTSSPTAPIVVQDREVSRTAIIMPMAYESTKPVMPRITPKG